MDEQENQSKVNIVPLDEYDAVGGDEKAPIAEPVSKLPEPSGKPKRKVGRPRIRPPRVPKTPEEISKMNSDKGKLSGYVRRKQKEELNQLRNLKQNVLLEGHYIARKAREQREQEVKDAVLEAGRKREENMKEAGRRFKERALQMNPMPPAERPVFKSKAEKTEYLRAQGATPPPSDALQRIREKARRNREMAQNQTMSFEEEKERAENLRVQMEQQGLLQQRQRQKEAEEREKAMAMVPPNSVTIEQPPNPRAMFNRDLRLGGRLF